MVTPRKNTRTLSRRDFLKQLGLSTSFALASLTPLPGVFPNPPGAQNYSDWYEHNMTYAQGEVFTNPLYSKPYEAIDGEKNLARALFRAEYGKSFKILNEEYLKGIAFTRLNADVGVFNRYANLSQQTTKDFFSHLDIKFGKLVEKPETRLQQLTPLSSETSSNLVYAAYSVFPIRLIAKFQVELLKGITGTTFFPIRSDKRLIHSPSFELTFSKSRGFSLSYKTPISQVIATGPNPIKGYSSAPISALRAYLQSTTSDSFLADINEDWRTSNTPETPDYPEVQAKFHDWDEREESLARVLFNHFLRNTEVPFSKRELEEHFKKRKLQGAYEEDLEERLASQGPTKLLIGYLSDARSLFG